MTYLLHSLGTFTRVFQSSQHVSQLYTTCDARFLQAATRLGDTTARIRYFAPTSTANFRVKHTRITNTMAEYMEESAKPTRLPTANAWIPTTAQLPTLQGDE